MSKRSRLIGFSLLLMMLLLSTSGIAAPGPAPARSPAKKFLGHLLELVSAFIDVRSGIDPWGGPAETNDVGPGIDP